MTEQDEQALKDQVEDLARLAMTHARLSEAVVTHLQQLHVQATASMLVATVTAGHLKGMGMLDAEALTEAAISGLPGGIEEQPECAKLIRDMLCGEELPKTEPMPKFTVIQGGKPEEG